MQGPRFRPALLVALTVLALCAGLGLGRVEATEEPAADGSTITTTLYPGWNMVGWVGPETPASELFDELPVLGRIFAWDGEEQRYLRLMPSSGLVGDEHLLAPGDGLWLYIGGTSPVEWTREASEDSVLLDLRAGPNLVAWAGRDGTPIEEAVARLSDRLELAWAWNAEAQEYQLYAPNAGLDQVQALNHGDALLVELSSGGRWWQPGSGRPQFVFKGDIPTEFQERFIWEMERIVTFFAERYGVEPPGFSVLLDSDSPWQSAASPDTIWLDLLAASSRQTLVRWYFHMLSAHFDDRRSPFEDRVGSPYWLSVGVPEYAAGVYQRHIERRTFDDIRAARVKGLAQVVPEAVDLDESGWTSGPAPLGTSRVGALAVEWLVGRVAASARGVDFAPLEPGALDLQEESDAFIEYFRPQSRASIWEDAFEIVFGMTVSDFHDAFGKYLAALLERS